MVAPTKKDIDDTFNSIECRMPNADRHQETESSLRYSTDDEQKWILLFGQQIEIVIWF